MIPMSDVYHHSPGAASVRLDSANLGAPHQVAPHELWKRPVRASELENTFRGAGASQRTDAPAITTVMWAGQRHMVGRQSDIRISGKSPTGIRGQVSQARRLSGPVRLILHVARAWALTNSELAALLAYQDPNLVPDLLHGIRPLRGPDREDRARLIYLIHETLSDLFVNPDDEGRWIRAPLAMLDGSSPLSYMIAHRIPGIVALRELVEQRLANR
jgi:hypothetical protein